MFLLPMVRVKNHVIWVTSDSMTSILNFVKSSLPFRKLKWRDIVTGQCADTAKRVLAKRIETFKKRK